MRSKNRIYSIITVLIIVAIAGCSKKHNPSGKTVSESEKTATPATKTVKTIKTAVPKVITVNDKFAKKSIDGRYYYDLEGHRYWRNNKDGKYYLFNKSMYDDPDFKGGG